MENWNVGEYLTNLYTEFLDFFPSYIGNFINFLFLVLLIVIYALFIWKFYRFISKRDFLGLNLSQYNKTQNNFLNRLIAGILFFIEYLVLSPLLILVMFMVFTFLLLVLVQDPNISQILIISAVIIATIRMTSYYKENLSQDISKMLPLTLLAVAVLNPNSFSQTQYLEKIINQIIQIPSFMKNIFYYLIFIVVIEMILRFVNFIFSLFQIEEEEVEEEEES
jgi:hypothetical protein